MIENVIEPVIEKWHEYLRGRLAGGLDDLLDDDVVFYSPIVYTPQRGKAITTLYLRAAGQTLPGDQAPAPAGDTSGSDESGSNTSGSNESEGRTVPSGGFRYTKRVLSGDTGYWSSKPRSKAST